MKKTFQNAALYLGRRGGVLTLFGLAWIVCGFQFATVQVDRFSQPGPGGPLEFMDTVPFPGLFWILCGLVGLTNGLLRRKLRNEDAIGYTALILPPLLWVLCYAWSFASWSWWSVFSDGPEYGRQTAVLGMFLFSALVTAVAVIAGWRDDLDSSLNPHVKTDGGDGL